MKNADIYEPKSDVKVAFKQNEKPLKAETSNGGFSLVELMVAVGLGAIVSAGVAAVFVFAIEQFTVLVEQNRAQEALLWAAYNTRAYLGQALDIRAKKDPLGTTFAVTDPGQVISSYASTDAAHIGKLTTIAAFSREVSTGSNVAVASFTSDIWGTGIFFRSPDVTPTGSSGQPYGGVLHFAPGTSGGGAVAANLGTVWFDHISEFRVQELECVGPTGTLLGDACDAGGATYPAKSATIVIKSRYFKSAQKNRWYWQQWAALSPAAQAAIAPFKDLEMAVKVGFRNNILLTTSRVGGTSSTEERLHGGIYFFRMSLPPLKN